MMLKQLWPRHLAGLLSQEKADDIVNFCQSIECRAKMNR
jgi:hypothetical protein